MRCDFSGRERAVAQQVQDIATGGIGQRFEGLLKAHGIASFDISIFV